MALEYWEHGVVTEAAEPEAPDPGVVRRVFGDSSDLALDYARLLATEGVTRGLLGPREVTRLWSRHIFNCAALAPLVPSAAAVYDVGSGAGLPGLVLAIARPDVTVTLVEPLLRRTVFLEEAVSALPVLNATVLRTRAEQLHGSRAADVVTARAVAGLDRLASWCLPLLREGGELLALKGARATEELEDAVPVLRRLRADNWSVEEIRTDPSADATYVVRVRAGARSNTAQRRTS